MKDDSNVETHMAEVRRRNGRPPKRRNKTAAAVASGQDGAQLEDFLAYMPQRSSYFFTPSRELWPSTSVDARLPPVPGPNGKPIKPSDWLAANAAVEQTTWAPGEPMLIKDRLVSDGGWIVRPGCRIFNLYRPPALVPKAGDVAPWLDLVHKVYPDEAEHIVLWLAHRVQRPWEKINHALVLGGKPGIGKDTILEPVKQAVGPWNFADVSPHRVLGSFNGFAKSVILRISEARDLGDWDRFAFFDRMKALIAAPPDVVQINEKHLREYYVPNLCGVIITSNHKTDGIYLPAEDRRHFVAWSNLDARTTSPTTTGAAVSLVRQRRQRSRRPIPRQPRPVRLRCQSAAAEDRGVLGDRQRQSCAGRRRACGRARRPRATRHRDARRGGRPSVPVAADLRRMAARYQGQRSPHPAPLRGLRLRRRAQPPRQRRTLEDQRQAAHDLRQGHAHRARTPRRRPRIHRSTVSLNRAINKLKCARLRGRGACGRVALSLYMCRKLYLPCHWTDFAPARGHRPPGRP